VLTELADGLSRGTGRTVAARFIHDVFARPDIHVVPADRQLLERGLDLFEKRPDKDWSLTDCISFVVMEREKVREALTADHHFQQAGFVALLKSRPLV
jgi:predicted nucleic acid-binding protein